VPMLIFCMEKERGREGMRISVSYFIRSSARAPR
jgi:hypothetical protein